ncbi:hypothetical protein CSV86_026445 [Pseudomonas putida CSV86]|uniref:LapA adhesin domain-containing protein n=1 Tax=Pseudomonas bharatica CSV86 TaxID=1005395 RepID=A0A7K4ELD4_9PSED|nr:immunoglobulin-like domain-containing protein [Pseudomonas bharatica]NNJ18464.1 hypothetical protein [Pseudomonas bharatica CSV86]
MRRLVISLANASSITIPVNATSGSVNYNRTEQPVHQQPTLTNSITGVSGGNFEKLEASGTTTTTVTDGPIDTPP